jgi:hypothetical protein
MIKDPRNPTKRQTNKHSSGRNTKSFDVTSTYVRPDARIRVITEKYLHKISNDDIILYPNFVASNLQSQLLNELQHSEIVSWAEGSHTLCTHPEQSSTFNTIVKKICDFLQIEDNTYSTRCNIFVDDTDHKPYHYDSAAFNAQRAKHQNITAAVSLGCTREVGFNHEQNNVKIYIPQEDGMLYTFGRDVNIRFTHGVNGIPEAERTGRGRISIVVWGYSKLTDNTEIALPLINNTPICRDFKKGSCRFGEKCRFSHNIQK